MHHLAKCSQGCRANHSLAHLSWGELMGRACLVYAWHKQSNLYFLQKPKSSFANVWASSLMNTSITFLRAEKFLSCKEEIDEGNVDLGQHISIIFCLLQISSMPLFLVMASLWHEHLTKHYSISESKPSKPKQASGLGYLWTIRKSLFNTVLQELLAKASLCSSITQGAGEGKGCKEGVTNRRNQSLAVELVLAICGFGFYNHGTLFASALEIWDPPH